MAVENPKDWKTYDQFAFGIDTNRLPATTELAGWSDTLARIATKYPRQKWW